LIIPHPTLFFFLTIPPPPTSTLFPYTTLFRSNFWRPVTAIREAATSGNPKTVPDPHWLPGVGNTTPDPSYPGAHAIISADNGMRSEEHTSELQSRFDLVCRLLLEKKKQK